MKTFFKPTQQKLFFVIAVLVMAVILISFRLYTTKGGKAIQKPGKPAAWSVATAIPDHVILTFSDNPATTQSVTWRTDTTVNNAVAQIAIADAAPRFYKKAQAYKATTSLLDVEEIEGAGTVTKHHAVVFKDLLPQTTYAYRVGDGKSWSEWFHFRTASNDAAPFTFLFLGDAQNSILENYSRVIRAAYAKAPDARFIIHAGDLVHGAHNNQQWHEWFEAGGWLHGSIASMPAPGNHEYGGYTPNEHKAGNRKFSKQWPLQFTLPQNGPDGLDEMAYYFDYQGVRFITLNSSEKLKEQADWLETVLKSNRHKWTVVTFHHPVFSAANHDDNKEMRNLWQPLFNKYGVDLVLTGHEHTYTRGQARKGSVASGPVYVVSVSGGNMYYFKEDMWKGYVAQLQRKGENTQLFQVINVNADVLSFKAYTATGELYDAFSLTKKTAGEMAMLQEEKGAIVKERNHQNTIAYKDKK